MNLSIHWVSSRLYQLSLVYFFLNPHIPLQGLLSKGRLRNQVGSTVVTRTQGTALEDSFLFTVYYCSVGLAYVLTRRETPPSAVSGVQWAAFAVTVSSAGHFLFTLSFRPLCFGL